MKQLVLQVIPLCCMSTSFQSHLGLLILLLFTLFVLFDLYAIFSILIIFLIITVVINNLLLTLTRVIRISCSLTSCLYSWNTFWRFLLKWFLPNVNHVLLDPFSKNVNGYPLPLRAQPSSRLWAESSLPFSWYLLLFLIPVLFSIKTSFNSHIHEALV